MINITDKMFKDSINEVAASDAGKIVFAVLKNHCLWDNLTVFPDDPVKTHGLAIRRSVYAGLREPINKEYLKEIEFEYTITQGEK